MLRFGILCPLTVRANSGEVRVPGVHRQRRPFRAGEEPVAGSRQADGILGQHNNVAHVAEARPYVPTGDSGITLRMNLAPNLSPNSWLSTKPSSSSDRTWTGPAVQHS